MLFPHAGQLALVVDLTSDVHRLVVEGFYSGASGDLGLALMDVDWAWGEPLPGCVLRACKG